MEILQISRLLVYGELNFESYHLERLRAHGISTEFLDSSCTSEQVHTSLDTCQAIVFNNVDINPFLTRLADKTCISAATGYSFINIEEARRQGVRIARLKYYSSPAVVDYMIAAAFSATRPLRDANAQVRGGDWSKAGLFGRELRGLVAGVLGYGTIGQALVSCLTKLGLEVVFTSRRPRESEDSVGAWVSVRTLFQSSDFIFICCDLNETTANLVDYAKLTLLKQGAVVVSISPNSVTNLEDLSRILASRPDLVAFLDLDPISMGHTLFLQPNAIVTPHIAFATRETLSRRLDECVDVLFAAMSGRPVEWIS